MRVYLSVAVVLGLAGCGLLTLESTVDGALVTFSDELAESAAANAQRQAELKVELEQLRSDYRTGLVTADQFMERSTAIWEERAKSIGDAFTAAAGAAKAGVTGVADAAGDAALGAKDAGDSALGALELLGLPAIGIAGEMLRRLLAERAAKRLEEKTAARVHAERNLARTTRGEPV